MLLSINENGTWSDPPPANPIALEKQDEEIFQTARLVNCGHFMAVFLGDYVAGFLGLGHSGNSWSINPFDVCFSSLRLHSIFIFDFFSQPITRDDQTPVTRDQGNGRQESGQFGCTGLYSVG